MKGLSTGFFQHVIKLLFSCTNLLDSFMPCTETFATLRIFSKDLAQDIIGKQLDLLATKMNSIRSEFTLQTKKRRPFMELDYRRQKRP